MTDVTTKDKTKNKVKNYANDYKPYWEKDMVESEKRRAPDRPEFRIFISHQKMGTETSAVPYSSQNNTKSEDTEKTTEK